MWQLNSSIETLIQRWVIWWCNKCTLTAKNQRAFSQQHKGDVCCGLHASHLGNVQKQWESQTVHLTYFQNFAKLWSKSVYTKYRSVWTYCRSCVEERSNAVFVCVTTGPEHSRSPFSCRFTFFECQELQCRASHSLCDPSKQTLVCVEWIRPGNVFLKVLDPRSFSQIHTCSIYTWLPLQTETLHSSSSLRFTREDATNWQPTGNSLWKHLQQRATFSNWE